MDIQAFLDEMNEQQTQIKIENYRRLNRFAKPGQVVFAGSSLMEQFPLYELVQGEGLPFLVYNRGISGFVTGQLLEVLDVCVLDLKPAHVFINIGTNDMNGPDFSLEDIMGRYETILRKIKEALPEVKLHLLAYYPVNAEVGKEGPMAEALRFRTNEALLRANEAVKELAGKMGADFYNLNGPLKDAGGCLKAEYTVEGMHMYADGYRAVLDELLPVLRGLRV